MTLSRPQKIVLGALSLWPILHFFVFFGFFVLMFAASVGTAALGPRGNALPAALAGGFALVFLLHFATLALTFGLTVFYIVYLFKTDRVRQDKKALWAVVLFLGNVIAMPVFFYLYVWPEQMPAAEQGPPVVAADVFRTPGCGTFGSGSPGSGSPGSGSPDGGTPGGGARA